MMTYESCLINDFVKKHNRKLGKLVFKLVLQFSSFEKGVPAIHKTSNGGLNFEKVAKAYEYKEVCVDEIFCFFKNRYFTNGKIDKKFKYLFKDDNCEESKKIKENLKEDKDKLYTCLKIAFRFRNNLFHGNKGKEINRLLDYYVCFEKIAMLMEKLIDCK